MNKIHLLLLIIFLALSACFNSDKKDTNSTSLTKEFSIYSKAVKDSFYVSVQLPEDYYKNSIVKFPTVYVLDANFHFPMLASVIRQYEKGEMLPPVILVG